MTKFCPEKETNEEYKDCVRDHKKILTNFRNLIILSNENAISVF